MVGATAGQLSHGALHEQLAATQTGGGGVLAGRNTSLGRTDSAPATADSTSKSDKRAGLASLQGGLFAGACSRAFRAYCREQGSPGMPAVVLDLRLQGRTLWKHGI